MRLIAMLAVATGIGLGAAGLAAGNAAASPFAAGPMASAKADAGLVTQARVRGRRVVVRRGYRGPRRVVVRNVYRVGGYYRPRRVVNYYGYGPRVVCRVRVRNAWAGGYYVPRRIRVCTRRW